MRAYHGDPAVKAMFLARVRAHREADQIIRGTYWEGGKGCAVGCTIHGSDHARYETELGLPAGLARLEDAIFEGLPDAVARDFPLRFLESIPVGADTAAVEGRFVHWLLTSPEIALADKADGPGKQVIARVAELWARRVGGDEPTEDEWAAANATANAAAWAAANATASAAARAAAWDAARGNMADRLVELLASAA